jgi:integrase
MRLEEWVSRWITVHGIRWEASTRSQRADLLDNWIEPFLGKTRLRELGHARVNSWRTDAIASGASPKTVNSALRVLSACLTGALEERLIPANPCIGMRPLPTPPVERRAIPLVHVEAIRATVPTAVDRAMASPLCYAGLRPQEIAGLRWSDAAS